MILFKKMAFIALSLLLSSFVYAGEVNDKISDESEVFIGVEVGGALVQGDTGGVFGESNHNGDGVSFGLRLGAENSMWRSMVVFDYFNSDEDDQNYERMMIQVDYFVLAKQFQATSFKPYIGVNGGYLNYESYGIDESGFAYGGEFGFTTAVSKSVDLDFALRYSIAAPDELDSVGNIAFGINYFY